MKNVFKCILILCLSLCFFGCKNDVFDASITEVFYTDDNPNNTSLSSLQRVDTILNGVGYYLVVDFHQPNMDVAKLILQYGPDSREISYDITERKFVNQYTWWSGMKWTVTENEYDAELKFYLEDSDGRRSSSYSLYVDFVK